MALKSTELRIGNLILDHKGELKTVTAFDLINLESMEKNLHHDPRCKDWRGIELNQEWMKKSGLEKFKQNEDEETIVDVDRYEFVYLVRGFYIALGKPYLNFEHGWYLFQEGANYDESTGLQLISNIDVKFVHQLQNLIRPLTGTELEIKD